MDTLISQLAQWSFLALALVCLALVVWAFATAIEKQGNPKAQRHRWAWGLAALLAVWVLAVGTLAAVGFWADFSAFPPRIAAVLAIPLATIAIVLCLPGTKRLLHHVPPGWLLYAQAFRIPVEVLLWALFAQHLLPVQMTFEGRNWDILAGLAGPVVAYGCFHTRQWPAWVAWAYNIAGLALLANIVATAILSMPSPIRVFFNEPANTIVAHFPVCFLPAVLVPMAYTMHFLSLAQLARGVHAGAGRRRKPPAS